MSAPTLKRHVPVEDRPGFYWRDERQLEMGFRYVDSDGRRQYGYGSQRQHGGRPWTTFKAASRARSALVTDVERKDVVITARAATFAEVRTEWQAVRDIRPGTAKGYDQNLRLYCSSFERRKIRDIDKAAILVWLRGLKSAKTGGELSPGTRSQIFAALELVFEHAVDTKRIVRNPCKDLKRGQRPRQGKLPERILTPDEERALLAYSGRTPWVRPIVVVALYQALRIGEVRSLRKRDVDFARGKLHVRGQLRRDGTHGPTKTDDGSGRYQGTIDLHPRARAELLELVSEIGPDEYVFRSRRGKPYDQSVISRAFTKARDNAGLSDDPRLPRFHDLRHTGISRLANDPRVGVVYAQRYARHEKLETTMGYVHAIESQTTTASAMEALNGGE